MYAYWWNEVPNFGDKITPYLIEKITGKKPVYCLNPQDNKYTHFCVGSILQLANSKSIVWGSGLIQDIKVSVKPHKIIAVRGPLTRRVLVDSGVDCPEIYGDPALLLPRFYTPSVKKRYKVGVLPHYVDYDFVKTQYSGLVIDPKGGVEDIIDAINSCKRVLSSSLHGLIVADAYGIETEWVEFSKNVFGNGFKFRDYFESKSYINLDRLLEVCPFNE
jgi:pyruvyltransferase